MDHDDRADRYWAAELGVPTRMLRTEGFHVCSRSDTEPQPRAVVVGTSRAAVVSLPEGRAETFRAAGLDLHEMEGSPRPYVASRLTAASLDVRGPAYLAYWSGASQR